MLPKSPEETRAFFRAHWTVRKYKNFAMPADHLDAILYAAQRAPTDATAQMYSFIRLTDSTLRAKIAALANNPHIATASESFLVCADVHRLSQLLKTRGFDAGTYPHIAIHFGIGDAVMAGQNMLIAAEMLGYRGCWIGGVLNALVDISELTQLPRGCFPFAALTIGVPDESPQERPRLPREQICYENRYQTPSPEALKAGAEGMRAISSHGDWVGLLARYFGRDGTMEARDVALRNYLEEQIGLK